MTTNYIRTLASKRKQNILIFSPRNVKEQSYKKLTCLSLCGSDKTLILRTREIRKMHQARNKEFSRQNFNALCCASFEAALPLLPFSCNPSILSPATFSHFPACGDSSETNMEGNRAKSMWIVSHKSCPTTLWPWGLWEASTCRSWIQRKSS